MKPKKHPSATRTDSITQTCDGIPQRLSSIFAHLRSLNLNSLESPVGDNNGNLTVYLDFTLDEADHHHLGDGFPELLLLSIGRDLPYASSIPSSTLPVPTYFFIPIFPSSNKPHQDFDPATGQLRIITLPTPIQTALAFHLDRKIHPVIADTTLGIDMHPIKHTDRETGAYKDLLSSYGPYTQAGAATLAFVLEDAKPSKANLTKGSHVLDANPSLKVVVTIHLSIASDGYLGNAKAIARSAENSFITIAIYDKADAPVQGGPYRRRLKGALGTQGGSIKLWISDFVADEELLAEQDRRLDSTGGADESRKPNIEIPYQSILKVLVKLSVLNSIRIASKEQQQTTAPGGAGGRVVPTFKGPWYSVRCFSTAAETVGNNSRVLLAALRGDDNVDRPATRLASSSGTALHPVVTGAHSVSSPLGASSAVAEGRFATPAVPGARVRGGLPGTTPGGLGLGLLAGRAFRKAAALHLKK